MSEKESPLTTLARGFEAVAKRILTGEDVAKQLLDRLAVLDGGDDYRAAQKKARIALETQKLQMRIKRGEI